MEDAENAPAYGRTNWRRFAVAVGAPTAIAAGLVLALQSGALAANFVISGEQFKLSASHLHGEGFTQYSHVLQSKTKGPIVAAMSGIDEAWISDLCQSVKATTPLGTFVLRIEAGKGGKDVDAKRVKASDLLIGMSELSGDATFTDIEIGVDASELTKDGRPKAEHGTAGGFGQQADIVEIEGLRQQAYTTEAHTFKLTGMSLKLLKGAEHECY